MEFMLTDRITTHYTCQPAMICDGRRNKESKFMLKRTKFQSHKWRCCITGMTTDQNRGPNYALRNADLQKVGFMEISYNLVRLNSIPSVDKYRMCFYHAELIFNQQLVQ